MLRSFNKTGRLTLLLIGLAAVVSMLLVYLAGDRDRYIVYAGDDVLFVEGEYQSVAEVLMAAGVDIRDEDLVVPSLSAPVEPGIAIQVQQAKPVTVRTEDGTRTVWTLQPNLSAFLTEAKIRIRRTDQIAADGRPVPVNALAHTLVPALLEIGRFTSVTIHDGENEISVRTATQTVGQVLEEAGLNLYATDGVEPPPGSWLTPGMHIYVRRSLPYTIQVDGRTIETRSHHTNVLNVLSEAGIGLVGQDYTIPGLEASLRPDETIRVIRVTEDFQMVDEPISYDSLFQPSDELEIDQRAVLQPGITGIMRTRMRVRYENGEEVNRTPDGQWIAQEPVNQIVGYGTQIVIRTIDTPDGPLEYWRVVRMRVTAYTAASSGKAPDHPAYGITASGLPAGTGIVAVDRTIVPWRSYVYVPGYGIGFAGDTGGGVKGRWIDLGYDEAELRAWSGYIDVYYLTPVPPSEQINYLLPTWLP
jgi:resuscitation-promoting factor RpfB